MLQLSGAVAVVPARVIEAMEGWTYSEDQAKVDAARVIGAVYGFGPFRFHIIWT